MDGMDISSMVRRSTEFQDTDSSRSTSFLILDTGIAFLAQMTFTAPNQPPTPLSNRLTSEDNQRPLLLGHNGTPENNASSIQDKEKIMASPFKPPVGNDTDLCLSLESLRGRKTMKLRGVEEIPNGELGCDVEADVDHEDDAVRV